MATVIRSNLRDILLATLGRLREVLDFPPERVLLTARDRLPFDGHGDQYVWLRPRPMAPHYAVIEGGGRYDYRMRRVLAVTARTRLALDEANQDLEWLTQQEAEAGHVLLEHKVIGAVAMFQPTDGDDNWLVSMPFQPRPVAQPNKDEDDPSWGQSTLEIDVEFTLDMDQEYQ